MSLAPERSFPTADVLEDKPRRDNANKSGTVTVLSSGRSLILSFLLS